MDKIAYSYLCCGVIFSIEQQLSYPTFQIGNVFLFTGIIIFLAFYNVKLVLISSSFALTLFRIVFSSRFEVQ